MPRTQQLREREFRLVSKDGMEVVLDALMMTSEQSKLGLHRMSRQQGSIPLDGNISVTQDHKHDHVFLLHIKHGKKFSVAAATVARRTQLNILDLQKENRHERRHTGT